LHVICEFHAGRPGDYAAAMQRIVLDLVADWRRWTPREYVAAVIGILMSGVLALLGLVV